MNEYLLGIDLGTSGNKCILINEEGEIIASSTHEYQTIMPHPTWTEQKPEDWWSATKKSIRCVLERSNVDPHRIVAIGLTGQMHGLVLLDSKGEILRPCILWNDQRTVNQCNEINNNIGVDNILNFTGNLMLTGFTAPKIIWVKENEPDIYNSVAKILLPKDYIRYCLSGDYFTDVSDASGTALFDVSQRKWSAEMLSALEIPYQWMPAVSESVICTSIVSHSASQETGLIEGTPIVGGGGDQATQAFGVGIIDEKIISTTIGTSGVVFAASNSYRVENNGRLHSFCHVIPNKWHLMGVMLSAGGSLRWFRDTFGSEEVAIAGISGEDPYTTLISLSKNIMPGSEGLIFLPYLTGERTPYNNPLARGVFFGISPRHQKGHFVRAILEGVAFGLLDSLLLIQNLGIKSHEIILSGGGSRSEIWQGILADIFGLPVITTNSNEGAAFGAALLAGLGVKIFETPEDAITKTVQRVNRADPSDYQFIYKEYYSLYKSLYSALETNFVNVNDLVEKYAEKMTL